jgi:DNA-binding XRE family transcriptional regulator
MNKLHRIQRKLTAAQQAYIDQARTAAEGPDRDDIIRQGQEVLRLSELRDVMKLLKAARESSGLSLRELEAMTGISRGNLSRLENGDNNPTIATLRRYAAAIGKTVRITVE